MSGIIKALILVVISTLISSCGFYVTPEEWAKCEKICKNNSGIKQYENAGNNRCRCINGVSILIGDINE